MPEPAPPPIPDAMRPPMPPPAAGYGLAPAADLPPGTELASVGRRIGAFFLAIPLVIVTLGIGYLVWGIVTWTRGTTPALQVLGCRLWVPDQQQMPGFWRSVLRNLVGGVVERLVFPIIAIVSFVLFLANEQHKSLHDLIGGTLVLHDPNKVLEGH
ncbi:MAG: RDD family protein [Mycobacteriales bacterium]